MATSSTRLGLRLPAGSDTVTRALDIVGNFEDIDAAVGYVICTSGTRPGSPYAGMAIHETDTHNRLVYDATGGGSWVHYPGSVVAALADVQGKYSGLAVVLSTTNIVYRWNGSAWVTMASTMDLSLGAAIPFASYIRSANQSVSNNTDAFIDFDQTDFSHANIVKTTSTGSVFTLGPAGVYRIDAQEHWAASSNGRRDLHVVNSSNLNIRYCSQAVSAAQAGGSTVSCSFSYRFTAGQAFKVMVNQDSGGALNLTKETFGPVSRVNVTYVGP